MNVYKVMTIVCIHVLYAVVVGSFVVALAFGEYVIAALCPVAYSLLRALWWGAIENGCWEE